MIVDVRARPLPIAGLAPRLLGVMAGRRPLPVLVDRLQQADEVAAYVQPSAGIRVPEGHGGIPYEREERTAVLDDHLRRFRGVGEADRRPVPEADAKRDSLQALAHPAEHPPIEAARRARGRAYARRLVGHDIDRAHPGCVVHRPDFSP